MLTPFLILVLSPHVLRGYHDGLFQAFVLAERPERAGVLGTRTMLLDVFNKNVPSLLWSPEVRPVFLE